MFVELREWSERSLLIVTRLAAFGGAQARVGPPDSYLGAMGIPRNRELRGLWFRADESPPWLHRPESVEEASRFLEQHADRSDHAGRLAASVKKMRARRKAGAKLPMVVLHPRSAEEPDGTEGSGFWVARSKGEETLFPSRLVLADFRREVMSRNSGAVDVEALARKSVCGWNTLNEPGQGPLFDRVIHRVSVIVRKL